MRQMQASEAKARLPQLLDDVERGETLIITRQAEPIARLVPAQERRQTELSAAIAAIKALQQLNGRITVEERLSARDEGRTD